MLTNVMSTNVLKTLHDYMVSRNYNSPPSPTITFKRFSVVAKPSLVDY